MKQKKTLGFAIAISGALLVMVPCYAKGSVTLHTAQKNPYVLLNQHMIQGLYDHHADVENVISIFELIFRQLPEEVTVFPTENYYYFRLFIAGRNLQGNIRLAVDLRDKGLLSFAYGNVVGTSLYGYGKKIHHKNLGKDDGVYIQKKDRFTYSVKFKEKTVTFHLNQVDQTKPKSIQLRPDEIFLENTFDESGIQFSLIFNQTKNYFLWILNEDVEVPDTMFPIADNLLVSQRTGFAYWKDSQNGDRKILFAIKGNNAINNNYFDGPFDQLADNYRDRVSISEYIVKWRPSLKGKIDSLAHYDDRKQPTRVSISPYSYYYSKKGLESYFKRMISSKDPYHFIARIPETKVARFKRKMRNFWRWLFRKMGK